MEKNGKLIRYLVPVAVLLVGVGFMIVGATNGQAAAVLKKAINICMECIGLG